MQEKIKQIKEAGVERFNHNINTSKNYHSKICTTHNFADRINTVKLLTEVIKRLDRETVNTITFD